ncbi:MAG: bifunctional 4-hydroxy-2-oxoglutarate aldolase/2-dehydro-3-deoxy-phosphogluconate aldolase [Planctomycetes bacterium]|nr:bifunctional 4-hydroxy-2-oxoglutarate aldolase/2-dehydro-3-deoxy-phosphogluconate aldolase [Planctomycetota bacterium]
MNQALLQEIADRKIIAIVRGVSAGDMPAVAEALLAGGISMMEITFDHTSAAGTAETLRALATIRDRLGDRISLGAGTVLTARQVSDAYAHGAAYIISPNVDEEVIARTRELGLVSMPGAFTPTEVAAAHKLGGDIVKLFPAALWGPEYIKAVRGPLAHIPLAAVGGVYPDNAADLMAAGVCCLGVGSGLVNAKTVAAGDFAAITAAARAFVSALA